MIYFFSIMFVFAAVIFPGILQAQKIHSKLRKEFNITNDLAYVPAGGVTRGDTNLGIINLSLDLELYKPGNLHTGTLHGNYMVSYGNPISDLVGDIQIASNIEAPPMAVFFEFWYEHYFRRHGLKFGWIDMNSEFMYDERSLILLNSSFGIQPTVSLNVPVSIFPLTAVGMVYHFELNRKINFSAGVFDGDPGMPGNYWILPDVSVGLAQGIFLIEEISFFSRPSKNSGKLSFGSWMHASGQKSDKKPEGNSFFGFHATGSHTLFSGKAGILSGWMKAGIAPDNKNPVQSYFEAGVKLENLFKKEEGGVFSAGFARADFGRSFRSANIISADGIIYLPASGETAVELTFQKQSGIVTWQPDIQYILNPSGRTDIRNPLCFIFRINLHI